MLAMSVVRSVLLAAIIPTIFCFDISGYRRLWTCVNGICERSEQMYEMHEYHWHFSQDACRLTCNENGIFWPLPKIYKISNTLVRFQPQKIIFSYGILPKHTLTVLTAAADRFRSRLLHDCFENCKAESEVSVYVSFEVNDEDLSLNWETDESYGLNVNTNGKTVEVKIVSNTFYGARHALETLHQLTVPAWHNMAIVSSASIQDRPAFKHRGLLIDTSRNFLHMSAIKRQIDGMAISKMNVLHWHATDTHSFPLDLHHRPEWALYGAYGGDEVYSVSDMKEIVKYAAERGVRVILEIDTPAHAGNGWQWANNVGISINHQPWRGTCIQPPCGQLNPATNETFSILGQLYKELNDIFDMTEAIHIGGDEVVSRSWESNQEIKNFMLINGMSFHDLWGYFHNKQVEAFKTATGVTNPAAIVWSSSLTRPEVVQQYFNSYDAIVQTWEPSSSTLNDDLINLGYRIIVSTKDAWYLDHGFWGVTKFYKWQKVYENRIKSDSLAIGGEVCMWGELVDSLNIDTKVWPRAAAAAERLWTNPTTTATKAEQRFYKHRQRLVEIGLRPDVIRPQWCEQNEIKCL